MFSRDDACIILLTSRLAWGGGVQENHITSEIISIDQNEYDEDCPTFITLDGVIYELYWEWDWTGNVQIPKQNCTSRVYGYEPGISSVNILPYFEYNNTIFRVISVGNFSGCTSLKSVEIPGSIDTISSYAFNNCTALESIIIEKGVTSIGANAFSGCISLTSITIPGSVKTIDTCAFSDCTSLASVSLEYGISTIGSNAFGNTSIETLRIPGSVKTLGTICQNNDALKTLIIEDGVTSIEEFAFDGCNLESVVIPGSVSSIGFWSFYSCKSLKSVEIAEGVKSIDEGAFYLCTSLESIVIPGSVTSIGDQAFIGCDSLKSVKLGLGVSTIGKDAFYNTPIESLIIPGSVTSIGDQAFGSCESLKSLIFEEGVTTINGSYAFGGCTSLQSVILSNTVSSIDHYVFGNCSSLTSIIIPGSVKWIGYDAFYGCTEMATIILEEGVETIESGAFNTNALTSVVIPSSVKSIGTYVFDNGWSPSLTSIYFKCPFDSLMYDRGVSSFLEVEYLYYKYAPDADKWIQYGKESGRQVTPFYYANYYDGDVLVEQRIVRDGDKLPEQYFENKDDEIFSGWVTDSGEHFSSQDKVKDDVNVQTSFIPRNEKRTITFVSDGSLVYNRMIVSPDDTITISHEKPSNGSNKFICWNTEEDGTGVSYYAGDSIAIGSSDIALYALWGYQSPSESPFIEGSFIIFGLIVFLFVIIIIIALLVRRRRKKRKQ